MKKTYFSLFILVFIFIYSCDTDLDTNFGYTPILLTPSNGEVLDTSVVNISWKVPKTRSANSKTTYRVFISQDRDKVENESSDSNTTYDLVGLKSFEFSAPIAGLQYYWKVKSIESDNTITESVVWSFMSSNYRPKDLIIDTPKIKQLVYDIDPRGIYIKWTNRDGINKKLKYQVILSGKDFDYNKTIDTEENEYYFNEYEYSKTYSLKIKGINPEFENLFSFTDSIYFKVRDTLSRFRLISPTASDVATENKYDFTWNPAVSSTQSKVRYEIYLYEQIRNDRPTIKASKIVNLKISEETKEVTGMEYGIFYNWYVKAYISDDKDNFIISDTLSLEIIEETKLEKRILYDFYLATDGLNWNHGVNNEYLWDESKFQIHWGGLTFNSKNLVTEIGLDRRGMSGDASQLDNYFKNFRNLKNLNVSHNNLTGALPIFYANKLDSIKLDDNNFSGQIPDAYFQKPDLIYLDLSNNDLEGGFPAEELINLPKIKYIDLRNNPKLRDYVPCVILKTPGIIIHVNGNVETSHIKECG